LVKADNNFPTPDLLPTLLSLIASKILINWRPSGGG